MTGERVKEKGKERVRRKEKRKNSWSFIMQCPLTTMTDNNKLIITMELKNVILFSYC